MWSEEEIVHKDYYRVLGLTSEASEEQITVAFRKLAMKYHPDRNHDASAKERFIEIYEAYQILSDHGRRETYDRLSREEKEFSEAADSSGYQSNRQESNQYENWQKVYRNEGEAYSQMSFSQFASRVGRAVGTFALGAAVGAGIGIAGGLAKSISVLALFVPILILTASYQVNRYFFAFNVVLCVLWYIYSIKRIWLEPKPPRENVRARNLYRASRSLTLYFVAAIALGGYSYLNVHLWFGKLESERHARELAFETSISDLKAHIADYLQAYPPGKIESQPRFRKGIVVVDMNNKDIYRGFDSIPTPAAARSDSQVTEIIQVRAGRRVVGHYSDGKEGFQQYIEYDIVDYKTRRTVFKGKLEGSLPPKTKSFSGPASGSSAFELLKTKILLQAQGTRTSE